MRNHKIKVFSLVVLLSLIMSLIFPAGVLADDNPPPSPEAPEVVTPPDGNSVGDAPPDAVAPQSSPAEQPVATEDAQPAGAIATEEPVATDAPVSVAPTDVATQEAPASTDSTVDNAPVISQVPAGTDVVVLDESGEVVPLASQEAADIVSVGDPIWCRNGVTPSAAATTAGTCTASYSSLSLLLPHLPTTNTAGTIWILAGQNSSASAITINGATLGNLPNATLTLQGGWGGLGGTVVSLNNPSVFSVPISVINWNRDVTVNNISISNAVGTGLTVTTSRNISLNNVTVNGTTGTPGNGASLSATGGSSSYTVNNSSFSNNSGYGLSINNTKPLTLNSVTFSNNGSGAYSYSGTLTCTGTTTQSCSTSVGTGARTCNNTNGSWGSCIVTACTNGATNAPACDVWPACPTDQTRNPTTHVCEWNACPYSGMNQDPTSGACSWAACDYVGMNQDPTSGVCSWAACDYVGMNQDPTSGACSWAACDYVGMNQDPTSGACSWAACDYVGMNQDPTSGACSWAACDYVGMNQDPTSGACSWAACDYVGMNQDPTSGACSWAACDYVGMNQDPTSGACSWAACDYVGMNQDPTSGACSWAACDYVGMNQDPTSGACSWAACDYVGMNQDPTSGACSWAACDYVGMNQDPTSGACSWAACDYVGMNQDPASGACSWAACDYVGMNQDPTSGACSWAACDYVGMNQDPTSGACSWPACPTGQTRNSSTHACEAITCGFGQQLNQAGTACVAITCGSGQQLNQAGTACETTPNGNNNNGGGGTSAGNNDGPAIPLGVTSLIPVTGGQGTDLSCTASTVLEKAGFQVSFANLCGYSAELTEAPEGGLSGALPNGDKFIGGVDVGLLQNGSSADTLPADAGITLSFKLPSNVTGENLVILYWDAAANGGAGAWVEKSVTVVDGKVTLTINMPGTFVLVDKSPAAAMQGHSPTAVVLKNLYSSMVNFFKKFTLQ